jgi:dimethylglycine dehydrogenase
MKSHVQVAVIGGGVVGCSVLYHLTKLGCRDVALLERKELTAGSSWHAAGGFHALNSDPGISRLQAYTIGLYREIEAISGQSVGLHFTGGLSVAATRERWDFLRADWARHRVLGLKTELLSPSEVAKICPIMDVSEVLGAVFDPVEGHLDPSGATHAFAKAARLAGAEIYRNCRVTDLKPTGRGSWTVVTEMGSLEAEHVVNAAGLWAREVGRMAGVDLPLIPMEHHYLITEDIPEIVAAERELPLVLDLDAEIYLRQERKGVLLGVYEKEATPWSLNGTPWEFGPAELLAPQLDRLTDALARGFQRFPSLNRAGLRRIVNGPFTFSPDGNPLVGPVPGLKNYWSACGVMAGFAQGGGVGLALAQWITAGEPDGDIYAMDLARFGPYATKSYSVSRGREFYAKRFQIAYPNEYWPAGRPTKTSALYDALRAKNAVFGVSYGLEIPLYLAPAGQPAVEIPSLRRSNAFSQVAAECAAARTAVGVLDAASFSKYEVTGPQAERALDRLLAGRLPQSGRIRLTPMLADSGRLMGDLTTLRLGPERFLVTGSGYLQTWHLRWFNTHLAGPGVAIRNVSDDLGGIAIFGPRSRELLARLTQDDVGNAAFPFMSVKEMDIGLAPAIVARLSVTGELGYEIYVPLLELRTVYAALESDGADLGLKDIGMYALNSLRLEKGFGIWTREFSRDYTAAMSGLSRFVAYDKGEFIGRQAALAERNRVPPKRLVTLEVDAADADAAGYEPIWVGEELVGFVTSAGYGHTVRKSLAMGYIRSDLARGGTAVEITILGDRRAAQVLDASPVDPSGSRMRQ